MTGSVPSVALVGLLVQDGIVLKGMGEERTCRCFSPAHEDANPSMAVNVSKGVYHCHGCGIRGNAYSYLHEMRGLPPDECHSILRNQYGWDDERFGRAQSDTQTEIVRRAAERQLEKPKWTQEIYREINGQPLEAVHEYVRADGTVAYVTARYKGSPGKPSIKGIPFTPAKSREKGGYWVKSPIGNQALAIPEPDRPFDDGEKCPVYGLPALLQASPSAQVWIVEGEKCADVVNGMRHVNPKTGEVRPAPPAISLRHGYRSANVEDPFPLIDLAPLRDRNVLVFADPDIPGHKIATAAARILSVEWGCSVRMLLPPIAEKGEEKIDVADVAQKGGLAAVGRWATQHGVRDYHPPPVKPTGPAPLMAPMEDTEHFRVLGISGPSLVVRRKHTQEIHLLRRTSITMEGSLLQIAPLSWWRDKCGDQAFSSGMRASFGDALLRAGEAKGMIDLSLESAGRGAHEHEGVVRFNLGDRLLEGGSLQLLSKELALDAVDFLYHPGPPVELRDDPGAEAWGRELYHATSGYRFISRDAHRAVMGWIVTSLIGGCLRFRPHLWILAPSGSGKTFLLSNILGRVFGPLSNHLSSSTEAGLAGVTLSDSLPATIDEFEAAKDREGKSKWDRILDLLRQATSGGGARTRANPNSGGVSTVRPRFSAFVASINRPDLDEADDNRFVTVRLSPRPVENFAQLRARIHAATDPSKMLALRTRIIRHAALIRDKAIEIEDRMISYDPDVSTRHAQIMSALTAGAWFLSGEDASIKREIAVKEDLWGPLLSIMGQVVRRPGLDDITMSECLYRAYYSQAVYHDPDPDGKHVAAGADGALAYKQLCSRHGFLLAGEGCLLVAPKLPAFLDLIRSSKHANLDYLTYLASLPGASRPKYTNGATRRFRFGGIKQVCVQLGKEPLEAIGFYR